MRAVGTLLLVAAVAAAPLGAQRFSRDWPPSDRAVLPDGSTITAVATTFDRVFVTTPSAAAIWRPLDRRWEGPFDPPRPGMLAGAFRALVDPLDQSLWLARPDGWVNLQPDAALWREGRVAGLVRDAAFDADDPGGGFFLQTSTGWQRVPPGGISAVPSPPPRRPVRAATVEQALRANPSLQANAAIILGDPRGRPFAYTCAAPSQDGLGWYLGTGGGGLLFLPHAGAVPERLSFGLPGDHVGAVFAAPEGVWVATDEGPTTDAAVGFVGSDLTTVGVARGSATFGLRFRAARRMAGAGSQLWLATDAGAVRIDLRDQRVEAFDLGDGLPDARTYSVLARRGDVYAGTARGVVRIDDTLAVWRVAPGFDGPAHALELLDDTLWVGTNDGVVAIPPGGQLAVRTPGLRVSAALRAPVLGLARLADTLVAMTPDQLFWRAPGDEWHLGPPLSPVLGRLLALTPYGDGVFVAGERGLGYARLESPVLRPLRADEHPGRIRDLTTSGEYLWVATEHGLVRWRIEAILP